MVKKGVVLAGGTGSRLFPITKIQSKHLLPVYKHIMIQYPLQCLKNAGIKDILIVTGADFAGNYIEFLKSGSECGMNFTYKIQEQAGGIAQALDLAEGFVGDENFCLILGDNIFAEGIDDVVSNYNKVIEKDKHKAQVVLKMVPNPHEYGIATFDDVDKSKIIKITEKPKYPDTNAAVTGVYFYPSNVFSKTKKLKPSGRGELEITDINNMYLKEGNLEYFMYDKYWGDVGTIDGILKTSIELQNLEKSGNAIL